MENIIEYPINIITQCAKTVTAAPANPPKMWSNGAFGYFAAYGNDRNSVIIE